MSESLDALIARYEDLHRQAADHLSAARDARREASDLIPLMIAADKADREKEL